jgi:septal ring-binding cell division protein DamX
MEKEDYSQLELFAQRPLKPSARPYISSRVLSFLRHYEKAIFMLMGALVMGIVLFSLGVEKGRRLIAKDSLQPSLERVKSSILEDRHAAALKMRVTFPREAISTAAQLPQKPPVAVVSESRSQGGFTVQLATYSKPEYAKKEAARLNKKGITTQILVRGQYFILCAGNFSHRQPADLLLTKLKKQYRDCKVRRL